MIRILTSVLLVSTSLTGAASFAASKPTTEASNSVETKVVSVKPAESEKSAKIDNQDKAPKASTEQTAKPALEAQKQTGPQASNETEIKLDEKPIPLFPANNDQKETKVSSTSPGSPAKEVASEKVSSKQVAPSDEKHAAAKNDASNETTNEAHDLRLVEFVLANQVESREPKNIVEAFSEEADRGFAFARLASKTTSEVTFLWTRNGHECARFTSPVQAAKQWRTFSSVKLRKGDWKVQLLDQNKVVLAEKTFTIQ